MAAPFCGYLLRKKRCGSLRIAVNTDRVMLRDGITRVLRIITLRGSRCISKENLRAIARYCPTWIALYCERKR